jgi:hypothetical protein
MHTDPIVHGDPNGLDIHAEEGDAATFVAGAGGDITGRTWTAAKATWTGTELTGSQESPDLTAPMQEVIDTSWAEDYDLALAFMDPVSGTDFIIEAYDLGGGTPAKFNCTYASGEIEPTLFLGTNI